LEPDDLKHWRRLWSHYGELVSRSSAARHSVRAVCEEYRGANSSIAAGMSRLWLADFVHKNDPRLRLRFLVEAWNQANDADDPALLHELLLHLNRVIAEDPAAELPKPLPARDTTIAVRTLKVFDNPGGGSDAFEQLCFLEKYFSEQPDCGQQLETVLLHQLSLVEHSPLRAQILTELGSHFRQRLMFGAASVAFSRALDEPGCTAEQAEFSLDRLLRLLPPELWKEKARPWATQLPPKLGSALLPSEQRAEFLNQKHQTEEWGVDARIAQVLEAFERGEINSAIDLCRDDPWNNARERLPLLALAFWLRGDRHAIPEALVVEALGIWDRLKSGPVTTFYLLAGWAGNAQRVARHAAACITTKQRWPMDHFWYLFFAASGQANPKCQGTRYRADLRKSIIATPMLAQWVVRSEIFFLFRRVWSYYKSANLTDVILAEDVKEFDEELDFIESYAANNEVARAGDFKFEFPTFVPDEVHGTLRKIAHYWRDWAGKGTATPEAAQILQKLNLRLPSNAEGE
jgi:hypothetical protein